MTKMAILDAFDAAVADTTPHAFFYKKVAAIAGGYISTNAAAVQSAMAISCDEI